MSHTGGEWSPVLTRELAEGERNAIVSNDTTDATYTNEQRDYGGTVIGEAILPKNMPLLLAAPALLDACRRTKMILEVFFTVHPSELAIKVEIDQLAELIARADPPLPSGPPWP
jgi:hypothetical protein